MTETDRKMKVISSCLVPFYTVFTTEDAEDTEVNLVQAGAEMNESFLSTIKLKNIKTSATCNEKRVMY